MLVIFTSTGWKHRWNLQGDITVVFIPALVMVLALFILVSDAPSILWVKIVMVVVLAILVPGWVSHQDPGDFDVILVMILVEFYHWLLICTVCSKTTFVANLLTFWRTISMPQNGVSVQKMTNIMYIKYQELLFELIIAMTCAPHSATRLAEPSICCLHPWIPKLKDGDVINDTALLWFIVYCCDYCVAMIQHCCDYCVSRIIVAKTYEISTDQIFDPEN